MLSVRVIDWKQPANNDSLLVSQFSVTGALYTSRPDWVGFVGEGFKPAIESPYCWRDWAAKSDGITGDELLAFINNEEATLPNGKKGAGLFAYLRKLTSSDTASAASTARDTVATVFKGVDNRMKSGYLLRDVVNKIAGRAA